jgi:hypothetical protein
VAAFLALAVAGVASDDGQTVRGAYLAMEPLGWFVLVPLSLGSLLTGLVQSLGSPWGVFRHYWVVAKLVLNLIATTVLLLYMQTLGELAERARSTGAVGTLRSPSPVVHAGAGLLLLLAATALAVYKPRGLTAYGRRRLRESRGR